MMQEGYNSLNHPGCIHIHDDDNIEILWLDFMMDKE